MTFREGVKDYEDGAAMLASLRRWLRINMGLRHSRGVGALYRGLVKWARIQEKLLADNRLEDFYEDMKRIWRLQAELQPALLSLELRRVRAQKKTAQRLGAERRRAATRQLVKGLSEKHLHGIDIKDQVGLLQRRWPTRRKRLTNFQLRKLLKDLGFRP
jgi:hypothetical protein